MSDRGGENATGVDSATEGFESGDGTPNDLEIGDTETGDLEVDDTDMGGSDTDDTDVREVSTIVSRRAPLLGELRAGPRTKAELTDALSVSRPTVNRGLRELESIEAVARTEDGYRLRLPGRLVGRIHERYRRRLHGTARAATMLAALPPDLDLDPAVVEDASIVTAGGPSLHRPIHHQRAMIEEADTVRGVWAALPTYAETYHEQAAEHDLTISLVVRPAVLERLLVTCGDAIERGLSTGQLALRERDTGPPCNLVVCDHGAETKLGLTVHDDDGVVGFLENTCPDATAWGEAFFERHWDAADQLVSPDVTVEE